MRIKELQTAAKADAKRKRGGLTRTGYATKDKVRVDYYPDCQRFAYFLENRRVNRTDVEAVL